LATLQTPHEWVYVIDADAHLSSDMRQHAVSMCRALKWKSNIPRKTLFVVPSFEVPPGTKRKMLLKKQLSKAIRSGKVSVMHPKFAIAYTGHMQWQKSFYSSWLKSDKPIQTFYRDQWEPYYITRLPTPQFDERFSDRGFNKAQQQFLLSWYSVIVPI
jgi:hypothetical protein